MTKATAYDKVTKKFKTITREGDLKAMLPDDVETFTYEGKTYGRFETERYIVDVEL